MAAVIKSRSLSGSLRPVLVRSPSSFARRIRPLSTAFSHPVMSSTPAPTISKVMPECWGHRGVSPTTTRQIASHSKPRLTVHQLPGIRSVPREHARQLRGRDARRRRWHRERYFSRQLHRVLVRDRIRAQTFMFLQMASSSCSMTLVSTFSLLRKWHV